MTHRLRCTCGRILAVPKERLGTKAKCPQCGKSFVIPTAASAPAAAEIDPPAREAAPGEPPMAPHADASLLRQLDRLRRRTGSAATNPALLRPNLLRYYLCYPKSVLLAALPAIMLLALAALVHWAFALPGAALLIVFALYGRKIRGQFVSGFINPGVVVSLRPPLIAAMSDLVRVEGRHWPVVQVRPHPLSRTSGGPPQVGQRLATVAVYYGEHDGPHWLDFDPVAANCVTGNPTRLQQMLTTIHEEQWQGLDAALKQLPQPLAPGQYKIDLGPPRLYQPERLTPEEVSRIIVGEIAHDPNSGLYAASAGIPPNVIQDLLTATRARVDADRVLAVVQSEGPGRGVLLTPTHVIYRVKERGGNLNLLWPWRGALKVATRALPWKTLYAASLHTWYVEIILVNGQRIRLDRFQFEEEAQWALEAALNAVAEASW